MQSGTGTAKVLRLTTGLCCELSKILLFTAFQACLGINMITECPSLAEVFALLLCLNHNHVQILLSKMVHQNREKCILC